MARVSAARVEADRLLFQGRWYPITKCLTYFAVEPDQWVSMYLDDGDRSEWRAEEMFRASTVTGAQRDRLTSRYDWMAVPVSTDRRHKPPTVEAPRGAGGVWWPR